GSAATACPARSLHDALPICGRGEGGREGGHHPGALAFEIDDHRLELVPWRLGRPAGDVQPHHGTGRGGREESPRDGAPPVPGPQLRRRELLLAGHAADLDTSLANPSHWTSAKRHRALGMWPSGTRAMSRHRWPCRVRTVSARYTSPSTTPRSLIAAATRTRNLR